VADYLVQEADGTSRFTLEDGSGFILLESGVVPPPPEEPRGGFIVTTPRHLFRKALGRFRARAVRITVNAPVPVLGVSLAPTFVGFKIRAAEAPMAVLFTSTAYEATSSYARKRPQDLDERIRIIIIHDDE
jgi:hypothetical protein